VVNQNTNLHIQDMYTNDIVINLDDDPCGIITNEIIIQKDNLNIYPNPSKGPSCRPEFA
jgi:hypothetical protein